MNTKKYLRFFAELAEDGKIPLELYDRMLAEIAKEGGRMNKRVYAVYLDELEKLRAFDVDGSPFDTEKSANTDGSYVYKRPKNPFWLLSRAVCGGLFKAVAWIAAGIGFGVWRVKDRKKLKGVGACITMSNHIGYLDCLLTRRAMGGKRQNIIVAPHNRKRTVGGAIIAAVSGVPLPKTIGGARAFADMLEYLKSKNTAIHFYAEQSMWIGYKKPRPYKDGAFYYADMLDVPIVPMLYCYGKPNFIRRLLHLPKMKIAIADPIYIDKASGVRARRNDVAKRCETAVRELYESYYGIPLEYASPDTDGEADDATVQASA